MAEADPSDHQNPVAVPVRSGHDASSLGTSLAGTWSWALLCRGGILESWIPSALCSISLQGPGSGASDWRMTRRHPRTGRGRMGQLSTRARRTLRIPAHWPALFRVGSQRGAGWVGTMQGTRPDTFRLNSDPEAVSTLRNTQRTLLPFAASVPAFLSRYPPFHRSVARFPFLVRLPRS